MVPFDPARFLRRKTGAGRSSSRMTEDGVLKNLLPYPQKSIAGTSNLILTDVVNPANLIHSRKDEAVSVLC